MALEPCIAHACNHGSPLTIHSSPHPPFSCLLTKPISSYVVLLSSIPVTHPPDSLLHCAYTHSISHYDEAHMDSILQSPVLKGSCPCPLETRHPDLPVPISCH